MKKIMIVAALIAATTLSAQRHNGGRGLEKDLSAEEIATLRTKKMTLDLALDKNQADKVYTLVLDQAKDRKAQMEARKAKGKNEERPKLTKEERFERANTHLDKRIAMQNEMKAILTDTQFEQYKRMEGKRKKGGKKKPKKEHRARK